jgi:hypothetical protein
MITPNLDSIQANEPSDYSDSLAQRENESFALASKRMDLESGWVGKLWGNDSNAPMNIAGTMALISLLLGLIYSATNWGCADIKDRYYIWTVLSPIISTSLGFIIGRKSNGK